MSEQLDKEALQIDSSDDDPIVPREVWHVIVANLFSRLREANPEKYYLDRIREEQPALHEQIIEKSRALEALGDARNSEVESAYRQLVGLFSQADWFRKGYRSDEVVLDQHGDVIAVRIHGRDFGRKPSLQRLIGSWAAVDESFESPDGRPVYQVEEIEQLNTMGEAEQMALIDAKLH